LNRCLPVALACAWTACVPTPESYPVPPQHPSPGAPREVVSIGEYVVSTQLDADLYFVRDVKTSEGANWRWTLTQPEFRFHLRDVRNRSLRLDLGVNDVTFRDTGPLRLAIYVNGHLLDQPVYNSPGDRRFEKPVPASMLQEHVENRVMVRVLNPWQTPDPNVRLGFLVFGVGFVGP
jgi:hypothetical protein